MDHNFYSIVEKLAILEGRIDPKEKPATEPKQKKPALFTNLKKEEKTDEEFIPMVSGVEFAEEKSQDVLSKVKASLADYLKSAEEDIKQDKDLLAKKKEDLDLKKKELKDLELQHKKQEELEEISDEESAKLRKDAEDYATKQITKPTTAKPGKSFMAQVGDKIIGGVKGAAKGFAHGSNSVEEAIPDMLEDHQKLEVGDRVMVIGPNEYEGEFAEVIEFAPSRNFVVVRMDNGDEASMHVSDVEFHDDQEDVEDWNDDENIDIDLNKHGIDPEGDYEDDLDEDPNQTPPQGEAPAGLIDPTYAESAPVKTTNVEWTSGGGSVLVEIHGDERDGFRIRRAGKELPTRFKSLEEAETALELFQARHKAKLDAEESADYIEER